MYFKGEALLALVLAVASAAPTAPVVDVYHPPAYSYSSSFVQHSPPVIKSYAAHPIVPVAHIAPVVPLAPVVKYHAPIVPVVKTYSHALYPTYPLAYKSPYVYAPHYF
ncbi:hypothetical protein V9T40_001962 [Parthenolecanium corni]|uniref:Cuticle protein n=1 Tax=Parthenolecanium corni TaxID=536013 RepID=A0AAN9THI6_9HEMI